MRSPSKLLIALILCVSINAGYTQTSLCSKPKLFSNFPNKIDCPVSEFRNAFSLIEGQHITLSFSDGFKFSGTVISNVVKYYNLQSMTIKSDLSEKTIFHLSKQINDDNSTSYVGRIMNATASDGYQIIKDPTGNYKFEKIDAERILPECNL